MGVNDISVKTLSCPERRVHFRRKKSGERNLGTPRVLHRFGHRSRVRERLEFARRISESFHRNSAKRFSRRESFCCRRDDVHFNLVLLQRDSEPKKKRSRSVSNKTWKRVR